MSPVNRITGFSGFDSESLIQKLMTAERAPLDKLSFKKQQMTWKQDMYRDVNKSFKSLFDMAGNLRIGANWNKFKSTSSDEASVSASGATGAGSHRVQVTQLAESAKLEGTGLVSTQGVVANETPESLVVTDPAGETRSITVEYDGVIKRIDIDVYQTDTTDDRATKIENALNTAFPAGNFNLAVNGDGKYELVDSLSNKDITIRGYNGDNSLVKEFGFKSGQTNKLTTSLTLEQFGDRIGQDFSAGVSFKVNGVSISATGSESVQQLMDKVNASNAGVKLSFDSGTKRFTFVSNATGQSSKVELDATANPFLDAMGFGGANRGAYGKDAQASIDGAIVTSSSNSITKDGVTYTVKKVTGSPVTINTERDVDALVKQLTDFVSKYNETIEDISSKLKEKVNRKIQPMSEEDRKNIKDTDLKLWEDAAKKGIMRNDDILSRALTEMRMTLYGSVKGARADGKDAYLSSIGITTASFTGGNGGEMVKSVAAMDGMIEVNEEKLRKALKENPEQVIRTFTNYPGNSVSKNSPEYQEQKGIMHRFRELFETVQKDISLRINNRGQVGGQNDFSIEKEIRSMTRQMEDMEDRLARKENQYYKRFAQMEKVMNQGNAQSSWLAAQMGKM